MNKEESLWDELFDTKDEAVSQLKILIETDWDSKIVKNKLIGLSSTFDRLIHEIGIEEKKNE